MVNTNKRCPYCENDDNYFVQLNQTDEYDGIEIAVNRQGMLRVRTTDVNVDAVERFEDVVEIKYCPACGKKFQKT